MSDESNQNYASETPLPASEQPKSVYPPVPPVSDGPSNPNSVYPPVVSEQPQTAYGYAPLPNGQPYPDYGYPSQPNGQPYPGYGYPSQPNPGYSFDGPPSQPLPLGKAIKQLPGQYLKVLTKPGAATFAQEKQKAAWNIIWVQLVLIAIIGALSTYAGSALRDPSLLSILNLFQNSQVNSITVQNIQPPAWQSGLAALFSTPITIFIGLTIYYFIGKAFKGRGRFIEYVYSYLLIAVPVAIITGLLNLIPYVGILLGLAISIYVYVLTIFMTMAVHRLSGRKATLVVFIIPIILIALLIVFTLLAMIVTAFIIFGSH